MAAAFYLDLAACKTLGKQACLEKTSHTQPLCTEAWRAIEIVIFDLSTSPDQKAVSSAAKDTANEPFLCETPLEPTLPAQPRYI